ncbi:MAG: hypothetical protein ACFCUG_05115 [Thiotrichales bacterium]
MIADGVPTRPRLTWLLTTLALGAVMAWLPVQAAVWTERHTWDDAWEARYSAWVAAEWTDDFLLDPKRPAYAGIAHDCADIPALARLIFAYENGLPFAIHDAAGGRLTHQSKRFDALPAGAARLRAFMNHVTKAVSTQTLPDDTYPIALAEIRPGDLYLAPGEHAYFVTGVRDNGVIEYVYSTTPTAAQNLIRQRTFPAYVPTDDITMRDGYRRFRRPDELGLTYAQIARFSDQQYSVARDAGYEFEQFNQTLAQLLGAEPETRPQRGERLIDEVCEMSRQRLRYVDDGVRYLQTIRAQGRRCLSESEYRQYSTFNRDQRLTTLWWQLRGLYRSLSSLGEDSSTLRLLRAIFDPYEASPKERAAIAGRCALVLNETTAIDLIDLWRIVQQNRLDADPHADRLQRWGLRDPPLESACPRYDDR